MSLEFQSSRVKRIFPFVHPLHFLGMEIYENKILIISASQTMTFTGRTNNFCFFF